MSEARVASQAKCLVLAVMVLASLAGTALGGPPLPGPKIPPPVAKPGIPASSLPPKIDFALEEGTRPCMETSAVPALRYRIDSISGGIRAVEIKRVLSDGLVTDSPYFWSQNPPLPASKEERRIADRHAAEYPGTLAGYKLEVSVNGTWFYRQVPFHFFPAMTLRPSGVVTETIASTNGRGGATVNYELTAVLEGISAVSVRGESVPPSSDPRSVTTSGATIIRGSPAHLRWTIHWPDGTEAFWRGARAHRFTASQRGTCGARSISVGPISGLRR
jgi:hypothetical protein